MERIFMAAGGFGRVLRKSSRSTARRATECDMDGAALQTGNRFPAEALIAVKDKPRR
jgi:hypothetical protein